MTEVKFGYGLLNPLLEEQANLQGYTLGKEKERLERMRESFNVLKFSSVITGIQEEDIVKKINKQVIQNLKRIAINGGDTE